MEERQENGADVALYTVFLNRAATGVERWQEISLDELGQSQVPYRLYGARKLKDFVEQCTEVAEVRGKSVCLRPEAIQRIKVELAETNNLRDGAAPYTVTKPDVAETTGALAGAADLDNDRTALTEHFQNEPTLVAGVKAIEATDEGGTTQAETALCIAVSAWATVPTTEGTAHRRVGNVEELLAALPHLGRDKVAVGLVHAVRHFRVRKMDPSLAKRTLAHSLDSELRKLVDEIKLSEPRRGYRSPMDRLDALATRVGELRDDFVKATDAFCAAAPINVVGDLSVDLIKTARAYSPVALPEERDAIDTHLPGRDGIVGPSLRRFCSACVRGDTESVVRERKKVLSTAAQLDHLGASVRDGDALSTFILPVVTRVKAIVDSGTRSIAALARPEIVLLDDEVKVDLASTQVSFLIRLRNVGEGRASGVVTAVGQGSPFSLVAARERADSQGQPAASGVEPFDLLSGADQIIEIVVLCGEDVEDGITLVLEWHCSTESGDMASFSATATVRQQRNHPDWSALKRRPPYTPKRPIEERHKLFGRDDDLDTLCHYARSGQSTFISGEKRVGKTSVLNVVQRLLLEEDVVVVFLRRGAIQDRDQGSIAHRIAKELAVGLKLDSSVTGAVPDAAYFGAFLGDGLVDFVDQLKSYRTDARFLVIFDEFEEINDALFIGDNVSRFTAGLRSLSELGLTFFLAGSERIRSIKELSSDFNNWGSYNLGRIESFSDLRALIVEPVSMAIEYSKAAVNRIVEYCQGNPYYTVLLCDEIYQGCSRLDRTHVSKADVDSVIDVWLRTRLIEENFSHFWEDDPVLEPNARGRHQAESALAIACVSSLGGSYSELQDVVEAQETFGLEDHQVLSTQRMRSVLSRLHSRGVLKTSEGAEPNREAGSLALDVFRDWMALSGTGPNLVERWRRLRDEQRRHTTPGGSTTPQRGEGLSREISDDWRLPAKDSEILSVCRALRGSDVTSDSLKAWLRQFNDDERMAIAWKLLTRLAANGYIGSGQRRDLAKSVSEAMSERRRAVAGKANGVWRLSSGGRAKYIDLCILWPDDGAAVTARLLQEQMPAGLMTHDVARVGRWIRDNGDRRQSDPILVLVDDFAGTGGTLLGGLEKLKRRAGSEFDRLVREKRVICCVLVAFLDAERAVQAVFPDVRVVAGRVLSPDVRAFHPGAQIFESGGTCVRQTCHKRDRAGNHAVDALGIRGHGGSCSHRQSLPEQLATDLLVERHGATGVDSSLREAVTAKNLDSQGRLVGSGSLRSGDSSR